jgi:predicted aspartyl protease
MAVTLQVNGYPVKAFFDTGAGAFFYRDQLTAAGINCNSAQPAGVTHGWAGKAVPVSAMIAEVKLGTLTRKIRIIIQDGGDEGLHQNLIGQDLVRGYQYEIEDKAGRVDLRKSISTTSQTLDPMYDVPCKFEDRRDIVQMEVNGHKISAFIDTGASMSVMDPETARSVGLEMTGGTQNLQGVGGNFSAELGTARVRIGPVVKDSFLFRVGGHSGTCIGQDFMEGWRFKADREHSLLRFFH